MNCLYRVEELLSDYDSPLEKVISGILAAIPPGWQYPEFCQAAIILEEKEYFTPGAKAAVSSLKADIFLQNQPVGKIEIFYNQELPAEDEGPFLKEERKLINTLADRIGHYLTHRQLKQMFEEVRAAQIKIREAAGSDSRTIIELLRKTDFDLYLRIARKILNFLYRNGISETETLMQKLSLNKFAHLDSSDIGSNIPTRKKTYTSILELSGEIFEIAYKYLDDQEIIDIVQRWMQEDKISFLVKALNEPVVTLDEIAEKLNRFEKLASKEHVKLSESSHRGIRIQLINKLMYPNMDIIKIAKDFIGIDDFIEIFSRMIYPSGSQGKFGGKGSGLVLAHKILLKQSEIDSELKAVKIPKTYYLTTDGLYNFVRFNELADLIDQKYKDIGQIRQEYPQVIEIFKNSPFPPEIIQKLSVVLDDFGDAPIIVRSSSLLEDQLGSAFSGKYESFFLANQGLKSERLEALLDAIAEVYASTFSPDALEYRAERDLIDSHEEMGVLIQEVVGTRVGKYYLPAYAGVAFSNNEFRWSPRIKRSDGLIRLVPGLGTRAVDRLIDDYPILVAPGQPGLRVNVTRHEVIRYSSRKIDVIDLEENSFETIDLHEFIKKFGEDIPIVEQIISIVEGDRIKPVSAFDTDFRVCEPVATFDGLIKKTNFIKLVKSILDVLQRTLGFPVDIEFASDGKDFYLLQCRPQSYGRTSKPAPIPKDIPLQDTVFTAKRYISNGYTPEITHLVYVDPQKYSEIGDKQTLLDVGRAVGKLNARLPKRQFILMGPGRWGSRGDIKLGVNVTYSDISNTAVLIEIARQLGNYLPDLSFGTHFFQDLVESEIRYIPLYPDEPGIVFNEMFLQSSKNILSYLAPDFAYLEENIKVIDIKKSAGGRILKILLNADLDEAIAYLANTSASTEQMDAESVKQELAPESKEHWRWRYKMAETIAANIDPGRFGLKAIYLIGSTKNGAAGPASDIDLLLHFDGDEKQRLFLEKWLEGWSLCLSEMNFLKTGCRTNGLLDLHFITDEDLKNKNSCAVKIGSVTDAAKELPMKKLAGPIQE